MRIKIRPQAQLEWEIIYMDLNSKAKIFILDTPKAKVAIYTSDYWSISPNSNHISSIINSKMGPLEWYTSKEAEQVKYVSLPGILQRKGNLNP